MGENATLVTREQYVEMLVDASCWDASELESGFLSWCERHVPTWRNLGHDEAWIRQRIDMAQRTRGLHRTLRQEGLTMLEIREELRKMYQAAPELYDLASARASPPWPPSLSWEYGRSPATLYVARPAL